MTADQLHSDPFVIDGREPAGKRLLLAAFGLFCLAVPTWELRHAFLGAGLGWWTLFFGFILVGAWTVGLAFLGGAIAGDGLHWTFRGRTLILERSSPLRRRTDTIHARDVVRSEVRSVDWDSSADTFRVVLHLRSGEAIETPDYGTEAYARGIEAEIRSRLGLG